MSSRLVLNDDAWGAIDALQSKIDRLRNQVSLGLSSWAPSDKVGGLFLLLSTQVRFLGERPHC